MGVDLTPSERLALQSRADQSGLLISEYVRAAILTRPVPMQARHDPAVLRALVNELSRVGNNLNQAVHVANTSGHIRSEAALLATLDELTAAIDRVIRL